MCDSERDVDHNSLSPIKHACSKHLTIARHLTLASRRAQWQIARALITRTIL